MKQLNMIKENLHNYSTIAAIPYKQLSESVDFYIKGKPQNKKKGIHIELPGLQEFNMNKEAIVAGRC